MLVAIAVGCLVLAILVPVIGMVLLGRFLFGGADGEPGEPVDETREVSTGRLSGRLVWRHLQTWFKAKPRRLPRR